MREILFRGKRVDNGEWVEGYFIQKGSQTFIASYPYFTGKVHETSWLEFCFGGFIEVIPETVGQYTGLTDKNGKKIFGGDIIVINKFEKGKTKKFRVEFDDGIFGIRLSANAYDSTIIPLRSFDYIEIIKGEEND